MWAKIPIWRGIHSQNAWKKTYANWGDRQGGRGGTLLTPLELGIPPIYNTFANTNCTTLIIIEKYGVHEINSAV